MPVNSELSTPRDKCATGPTADEMVTQTVPGQGKRPLGEMSYLSIADRAAVTVTQCRPSSFSASSLHTHRYSTSHGHKPSVVNSILRTWDALQLRMKV